MDVKSNKEVSFGRKLDNGWTDNQLMEYYGLNEKQLQKVKDSLAAIRAAPKKKL